MLGELLAAAQANHDRRDWQANLALLGGMEPASVDPEHRRGLVRLLFLARFHSGQVDGCVELLREYARMHVDDEVLAMTDPLLERLRAGRRIIATFDPERQPHDGEWVIRYGDYPLGYDHLLCHNPVHRHLRYFWQLQHDEVEYDRVWDPVESIYIINLEDRYDRYIETLRELKRMKAPLLRVSRFLGFRDHPTPDPLLNRYVGCFHSHQAVMQEVVERGYDNVLVLEDDFCFHEDLAGNRESLRRFFERRYRYHVCLLAAANRYAQADYDDLIVHNRQAATTASGYLVSREGARRLAELWARALERLVATRETRFLGDQAWTELQQHGQFFMFARKLGFQRINISSITNQLGSDLD